MRIGLWNFSVLVLPALHVAGIQLRASHATNDGIIDTAVRRWEPPSCSHETRPSKLSIYITGLQKTGTTALMLYCFRGLCAGRQDACNYADDCTYPRYDGDDQRCRVRGQNQIRDGRDCRVHTLPISTRARSIDVLKRDHFHAACFNSTVVKSPDNGMEMLWMIDCLRRWDVPILWVQRNPLGWIRSQCHRMRLMEACATPGAVMNQQIAEQMPDLYRLMLGLGYNVLFPDLPPCGLGDLLMQCFTNLWLFNLRSALLFRRHYHKTVPVHYDHWIRIQRPWPTCCQL